MTQLTAEQLDLTPIEVSPRRLIITADRAFADVELFDLLNDLGVSFVIRSKGNVKVNVSQQSLLVEFLSSIRIIKAFKLEAEQTRRFAQHSRELVHLGMKGTQAKELINPIIETIGALGLGVLIVYILIANKSGSDLAVFIAAVAAVYTPIKKVAGLHILFQQSSAGVERLLKIMREQPSVREPAQPKTIQLFSKEVRFENVSPVLKRRSKRAGTHGGMTAARLAHRGGVFVLSRALTGVG